MKDLIEVQKKIVLLGDGAVGKTSLVRRFVVDKFDDKYIRTIGSKVTAKSLQIDMNEEKIYLKLQIWDIIGQKGYTKLHYSTFRGMDGILAVADITRKDTLHSLETYWIPKVHNIVSNVPFIVLVNKSDLAHDAEIATEDLIKFTSKYNVPFYFTSAKNGGNVKKAFNNLGGKILEFKGAEPPKPTKPKIIHPRLLYEGEKGDNIKLIDRIIDDFCREFGSIEDAMPIIRRQFDLAELDVNNPKKPTLRVAIERLAAIEKGFKEWEIAEANRQKRLRWVRETHQ